MKKIFFYFFLILYGCSTKPVLDLSNDVAILREIPMKINCTVISTSNYDSLFICKGLVTDSVTSENLPSANIFVIGSKRIIKSNINGMFMVDGLQKNDTLLFGYVGYIKKKVFIKNIITGKTIW